MVDNKKANITDCSALDYVTDETLSYLKRRWHLH